MTPRVSRRRMFVSALMASSLFAVTACTSAGSRPPQSASVSRQSASHKPSASPSVTASVVPAQDKVCLLYTSPSPRDLSTSRMPSSA